MSEVKEGFSGAGLEELVQRRVRSPEALAAEVDARLEAEPQSVAVVVTEKPPEAVLPFSHHLVALTQEEMVNAHGGMLAWVRQRQVAVAEELKEEEQNLAYAKSHKWSVRPFEKRVLRLKRQVLFYEKVEAALAAGFVVVPNFDMDVFAIRTKAKTPRGPAREGVWNRFTQEAQLLPIGEGEYRNPDPKLAMETVTKTNSSGQQVTAYQQWPEEFRDITFPFAIARPEIVSQAGAALALKLFDEVGVAVNRNRSVKGDPILLGHLRNPKNGAPGVTFFLAWYYDLRAL